MTHPQAGFTLVELAIGMIIISLLIGGAIATMSAQHNLRMSAETKELLEKSEEALIGFAIANGRLPCPAKENDPLHQGWEAPKDGGPCESAAVFLPARMLGLSPVDSTTRLLIDSWGNPVRYEVTNMESSAFTSAEKAEEIRKVMQMSPSDQPKIDSDHTAILKIYSLGTDGVQSNDDISLWLSPYKFYNRMIAAGAL